MGYVLFMFTHRAHACERACASARVFKHSLIFGRILFKLAGQILQMTTRYMGYIICTHLGRACASACVIKHSLIYGRFLFKLAVSILHITTNSMGSVLFMFTNRAHAFERAWASARVVKYSLIFGRILAKFGGDTTYPQRLHGRFNVYVNACPYSAHQYTFANCDSYDI
jgi:hypothetical protein